MLSKRPVLRITAALFFLLNLFYIVFDMLSLSTKLLYKCSRGIPNLRPVVGVLDALLHTCVVNEP